jgi:hypothetical protein
LQRRDGDFRTQQCHSDRLPGFVGTIPKPGAVDTIVRIGHMCSPVCTAAATEYSPPADRERGLDAHLECVARLPVAGRDCQ